MENDKTGEIELNPSLALEKLDSWLDGFIKLLPNLIIGLLVIGLALLIANFIKKIIVQKSTQNQRANLGQMLGGFFKAVIIVLGFLLAATIVMPSLNVADLIAGLGVGSVAIGFAFKDILQNWLAGFLILLRQPFEIGDQIKVDGFEGTVEHIETRATQIKTYDGQKVLIPNSEIYTNPVTVKNAFEKRRSQYDVGIGYGDDPQEALKLIKDAVSSIDGVETDPEVQVLPWDLAASWVTLRVRWWTNNKTGSIVQNKSNVIQEIKRVLDDAGIDMPYDTKVHLFHDQTEDRDGDPTKQREGWPAPKDAAVTPRWKKENKSSSQ